MEALAVTRIPRGWQVILDGLTIAAESPHYDRGAIRVALTVRNGTAIYYRDAANLTSARVRFSYPPPSDGERCDTQREALHCPG